MKRLLITGASGFIGGFLIREALKQQYQVYAGVRQSTPTDYFIKNQLPVVQLNYSDLASLKETFERLGNEMGAFDYIIHNAGITKTLNVSEFQQVNTNYTINLVNALTTLQQPPEKFIYISSLAAVGPNEGGPVSAYGKSKLMAEKFLYEQAELPWLIFRPTAVYGPGDRGFLNLFKMLKYGIEMYIGNHEQSLTFIYVKDLARVIVQSLSESITHKSYNVTDGEVYSRSEMSQLILSHFQKRSVKLNIPMPLMKQLLHITDFYHQVRGEAHPVNSDKLYELAASSWKCEMHALFADFNFQPEYNLVRGIDETYNWYKHEKWI